MTQTARRRTTQQTFFDMHHDGCSILLGDAQSLLTKLPEKHFQCCITSPPYWGVRDYDVAGQIGAEVDVKHYLRSLVATFGEVRRVLKDDGTLWLNLGDVYTSGNRRWRAPDKKNRARAMSYRPPTPEGLRNSLATTWSFAEVGDECNLWV